MFQTKAVTTFKGGFDLLVNEYWDHYAATRTAEGFSPQDSAVLDATVDAIIALVEGYRAEGNEHFPGLVGSQTLSDISASWATFKGSHLRTLFDTQFSTD